MGMLFETPKVLKEVQNQLASVSSAQSMRLGHSAAHGGPHTALLSRVWLNNVCKNATNATRLRSGFPAKRSQPTSPINEAAGPETSSGAAVELASDAEPLLAASPKPIGVAVTFRWPNCCPAQEVFVAGDEREGLVIAGDRMLDQFRLGSGRGV